MKNLFRRGLSLLLAVMIIVSAISISSFAVVSKPQISNTGERGEICTTFNDTTAPAYYTGSYSYANLASMSASSLKSALNALMKSTHKNLSSYDNCRDYGYYTDCENGDYTYVTTIYTSHKVSSSGWASGWNREHVWPKSLGGTQVGKSESEGGSDLHHIRPAETSINSTRGNKLYGEVSGGTEVSNGGRVGGYYSGNYFEPLDNVKGDVARICLYVYVRWGADWAANEITQVFQSVDVLLEWCALDPVDTWEMERNDVVESVQGNRNVFIDYPEFAWMIFGRSVPANLTTPSDGLPNGSVEGGTTGGGTTPDVPTAPDPEDPTPEVTPTGTATISFATEDNRTSFSTSSQVWEENGIKFTNNKTGTSSAVGDYIDPVRIYKGSQVIIESPNMTKIVIKCPSSSNATGTKVGLENAGYNVSIDGGEITVVFDSPVNSITYTASEQTRINSIDVYYAEIEGGGTTPDPEEPDNPTPETPVDPQPNPGEDIGGSTGGDTGGSSTTGTVTFEFGENGAATHSEGSTATSYSETNGNYTLNLTSCTKIYKNARDAKGNSALKMGTSDYTGSFTFTVPSDVSYVVIKVAKYKDKTTVVNINGTDYTITTLSNNGEYTEITVDTTSNKTVTVSTTSSGKRAMIDSITYGFVASGCDHNYNEHGYCKTCEVGFRTASLVLSSDLAIRYGIEIVDSELLSLGAPKMIFTFDGKTYEVVNYVINDEYYVFVFDGISPDRMTVNIKADFYVGDTLVATFDNYTIEMNLISIRSKHASDATLVQLVNDVLVYGKSAQKYTGKNSDDLAGDGVSNVVPSTGTPVDELLIEGNNNANLRIKSVGVHFDCVNYIYIKIYVADPASFRALTVEDESYTLADMTNLGGGNYRLNLPPVMPTDFSDIILITLTGSDADDYTSVIYSVDCYAAYIYGGGAAEGTPMYELALALYRYGKSAKAYSIAHTA